MISADLASRIKARLDTIGCRPDEHELAQLAGYCELLSRWNRKVNLTALALDGFPDGSLDVLLVEPLVLVGLIPQGTSEWLDFGSGGGSPALPVKIMVPNVALSLVEVRAKKAAFLQEVIRSLGISAASVRSCRIEELDAQTAQLVTVRGVKMSSEIIESALRVLQPNGHLAAFGTADEPKWSGFELEQSAALPIPGHALHILKKVPSSA